MGFAVGGAEETLCARGGGLRGLCRLYRPRDRPGSDKTYPHMAVQWAWAFDSPFKWTKQVALHFGGTRQGLAISWPGHIKDVGACAANFTTSSISCRPSSRLPASKSPSRSMASSKGRSKA